MCIYEENGMSRRRGWGNLLYPLFLMDRNTTVATTKGDKVQRLGARHEGGTLVSLCLGHAFDSIGLNI